MSTTPGWFATTHWSVVVRLGDDSTEATEAFAQLYRAYWYPSYAYVRRLGYRKEEAEDLVQAFFARCLEKDYLRAADPAIKESSFVRGGHFRRTP